MGSRTDWHSHVCARMRRHKRTRVNKRARTSTQRERERQREKKKLSVHEFDHGKDFCSSVPAQQMILFLKICGHSILFIRIQKETLLIHQCHKCKPFCSSKKRFLQPDVLRLWSSDWTMKMKEAIKFSPKRRYSSKSLDGAATQKATI